MPEITLREAVTLLEERIKANPESFRRAVGGTRMFVAILALIQYVKSLPDTELDRKLKIKTTIET